MWDISCSTPVMAGHEVISVSRQERQPYSDHYAWKSVRRITIDRNEAETHNDFGNQIAKLLPDAVIDMICFKPESARVLLRLSMAGLSIFFYAVQYGCMATVKLYLQMNLSNVSHLAITGLRRLLLNHGSCHILTGRDSLQPYSIRVILSDRAGFRLILRAISTRRFSENWQQGRNCFCPISEWKPFIMSMLMMLLRFLKKQS